MRDSKSQTIYSSTHYLTSSHDHESFFVQSLYIKKKVCQSVCLFFMHLDTVRASAAKLSRNPLLNQEKVESYFFSKNYKSFPPKTNPSISNQWDCSIPWYRRSTLQDFKITQRTSHHRFSRAVSPNLGSIWVKSYWLTSNQ